MNFGEPLQATMSPFLSGTNSPVPGGGGTNNFAGQQGNKASSSQIPTSMAMAAALNASSASQANPALAYANAQLAQYAQQNQNNGNLSNSQALNNLFQPQANNHAINAANFASLFSHSSGVPAHLNPHALSAALADYSSQSVPNSAASSPGMQHKRLPGATGYPSGTMTGTNTPGGNSRVAASAITGKRLNWSEMICQTIAESEYGRLVIQDLFDQMCTKFPEIREWAFGKDWEARVKNRIKSTLSIKGNLFIKVPRPSSAHGKGSWWTLSQEAQDAWKEGRVASVVKNGTHSRSTSQGRVGFESLTKSNATSRANSRAPSRRGSPVSSRGPSSHHANRPNHNNLNFSQVQQSEIHSNSPPSVGSQGDNNSRRQSPSSGLPASLGMSPINFGGQNSNTFDSLNMSAAGLDNLNDDNQMQNSNDSSSSQNFGMMDGSLNGAFGNNDQQALFNSLGNMNIPTSLGMTAMANPANNLYSISPYNAFSTSATAQHLGTTAMPAHLGGPQSMPFPATSNAQSNSTNSWQQNITGMTSNAMNPSLANYASDPTFGAFAGLDLSNMDGLNNPFGSMAGGYTMLGDNQQQQQAGAQPTPIPGRNGAQGSNGGSGSGGRGTPSASSFNAAFYSGPSPADSTGSTSAFFAYTPAMQAADAAQGGNGAGSSALGPVGGEGSKKKRDTSTSVSNGDFALPPAANNDANKDVKGS